MCSRTSDTRHSVTSHLESDICTDQCWNNIGGVMYWCALGITSYHMLVLSGFWLQNGLPRLCKWRYICTDMEVWRACSSVIGYIFLVIYVFSRHVFKVLMPMEVLLAYGPWLKLRVKNVSSWRHDLAFPWQRIGHESSIPLVDDSGARYCHCVYICDDKLFLNRFLWQIQILFVLFVNMCNNVEELNSILYNFIIEFQWRIWFTGCESF